MVLALAVAGCAYGEADSPPVRAGKEVEVKEHRSGAWTPGLSDEEKATVFSIAEDTLRWCVDGSRGEFTFDKYAVTPKLKTPTHTFVTLKIRGMLRGCIGSLPPWPAAPLFESVHNNAVSAALKDYRFRPVRPEEVEQIDVHVSLLSPVSEIASIDDFKIGEHGIILEKGRNRAVYLPEVATEQKWTKEQTLSSLSQKARMMPDAWREGASLKVFSSVVLGKQ
jgi:AmmeMemoRadiSam system protein A